MYEASFCLGRFNPPTLAHSKMIEWMIKTSKYENIFIFIIDGEKSSKDKNKNPLDIATRLNLLSSIYNRSEQNKRVIFDSASNLFNCFDILDVMGFECLELFCGGDRYDSYKNAIIKYDLNCDIRCFERTDDISATKVRNMIRTGDNKYKKLLHPRLSSNQILDIERIICQK